MKVWIVYEDVWQSPGIIVNGVFDSKEKADEHVKISAQYGGKDKVMEWSVE